MKDVHFLLDEISEQDKKEVKDIIKRIKTKSQKVPKEVIFLRKFTLSLMKQYAVKKAIPLQAPHPLQLNIKETQSIPEQITLMPRLTEAPEPINLLPKISSNEAPEPLRIVDLHQAAPIPQIPTPNKEVNAIKKELSIPMPN